MSGIDLKAKDDCARDDYLLHHFAEHVKNLICPMLQAHSTYKPGADIILSALQSNKVSLHCCRGISAIHLKATTAAQGTLVDCDIDIARHAVSTVIGLSGAVSQDSPSTELLQMILWVIYLQSLVSQPQEPFLELDWHKHFLAAAHLCNPVEPPSTFNMALASWIDIIGATMLGARPHFVELYKDNQIAQKSLGLAEIMGCDDHVMYVIAATAALEASKLEMPGLATLDAQIDQLELDLNMAELPFHTSRCENVSKVVDPCTYITALFRIAACIYLHSLASTYDRSNARIVYLIDVFGDAMTCIPPHPAGLARSLVWPLLVAGSVSLPGSSFRKMFMIWSKELGLVSEIGSFGKVRLILDMLWSADNAETHNQPRLRNWREVVQKKGWDFLAV